MSSGKIWLRLYGYLARSHQTPACRVRPAGLARLRAHRGDDREARVREALAAADRRGQRHGPPPPVAANETVDSFASLLATKTFTHVEDTGVVTALYERTLHEVLGSVERLAFMSMSWGDDDFRELVAVLPLAREARVLHGVLDVDLSWNEHVTDVGLGALADALVASPPPMPQLRMVELIMEPLPSKVTPAGLDALREACGARRRQLGLPAVVLRTDASLDATAPSSVWSGEEGGGGARLERALSARMEMPRMVERQLSESSVNRHVRLW